MIRDIIIKVAKNKNKQKISTFQKLSPLLRKASWDENLIVLI